MTRRVEDGGFRRGLRSLALGTAASAIWPSYLLLLAYVARQAPWLAQHEHPGLRDAGRAGAGAVPARAAEVADAAVGLGRAIPRDAGPGGPATGRAGRFVIAAAAVLLLPAYLIDNGLIAPEGRLAERPGVQPVPGPGLRAGRLGGLRPPAARPVGADGLPGDGVGGGRPAGGAGGESRVHAGLAWISRHRRRGRRAAAGGHRRGDRAGRARLQLLRPPAGGGRLADRGGDRPGRRRVSGAWPRRSIGTSARWARPHRRRSWAAGPDLGHGPPRLGPIARRRPRPPQPAAALGDAADPAETALRPEDLAAGLRPARRLRRHRPGHAWPSPGSGSSTWPSSASCSTSRSGPSTTRRR